MRVLEISAAVALTVVASVGVLAMGWYRSAAAQPAHSPPPPLLRVQAVVRQLDLKTGLVRVGDPIKPIVLHVGDRATVFNRGRFARLEELRVGQSVCAAYEEAEPLEVQWIEPCAN